MLGSIKGINFATADTRVGIGTTAPKQKLHVKGQGVFTADPATFDPGDGVEPAIRIGFDSNGGYGYINANHTGVTAKNLILQPNSSQGNVGIGTTTPSFKLHVNGSVAGVGAYNNLSDGRYKRDIRPLTGALDKVLRLRGVSYEWRQAEYPQMNFSGGRQLGFIAQELEPVLPEAVSTDVAGVRSLVYTMVVPLLVEALKEQQAQIQQQRELIERQRALAERQQQQLNALKRLVCRSHRRSPVCK